MKIYKNKVALAAAVSALALAIPAIGQEKPESLLPPGFDQPPPPAAPPTQPQAQPQPQPGQPAPPPAAGQPLPPTVDGIAPTPTPTSSATPTIDPALLAKYELPDYARRSLDRVGLSGDDALPATSFGRADGRFLEILMRRTRAPVASRWLSIALRRLLVSAVDTPGKVGGADFAAERAWMLLRMGEAPAARAVVQSVDPDRASPKLMQVGMQAALATGDPAAMCPFADRARAVSQEPGWTLAGAMCLALSGSPGQAGTVIDAAKRSVQGRSIDILLAEKVVGAAAQGRRAVTVEWDGVSFVSAWRYGLAMATGVEIPAPLFATAGVQARYWRALSPVLEPSARARDAEAASAQGILSNLALVDLYGEIESSDESSTTESTIAGDLRTAYVGATAADRVTALKGLWDDANAGGGLYGRLVLTARAAARVRPADGGAEADRMVAAILSAGLDRNARRWEGSVPRGGDAWAMLALSDPVSRIWDYSEVARYGGADAKAQLFFAGMAGLGRLSPDDIERGAGRYGVNLGANDPWTRAIDTAARADQPGTVLLLCAAGMQTRDWRGVSASALYRMVAALRATGLDGYARMIAAEAIART